MNRTYRYRIFSKVLMIIPLKWRISIIFFVKHRKTLSFKRPRTFNEKIQVRKVFDRNPHYGKMVDKIGAKDFVKGILGEDIYCPKTLWVGDSASDILNLDLNDLPNDYVIKANHTSQTIIIVRDGKHPNPKFLAKIFRKWLKEDQYSALGEWAYSQVKPRIFIEEFLDFNGSVPDDFKFFVYSGKVKFIQFDTGRFFEHRRNMYDRNWQPLGFEYSHKSTDIEIPKPDYLEKLILVAEKIGALTDFARVDLYFYHNKVVFSEITLYPGAGFERFPSHKYDLMFGEPWITP